MFLINSEKNLAGAPATPGSQLVIRSSSIPSPKFLLKNHKSRARVTSYGEALHEGHQIPLLA